ncbi:hypothetical protein LLH03_14830, partial [bacterium]|nr:hypothetical protein [bacterium]
MQRLAEAAMWLGALLVTGLPAIAQETVAAGRSSLLYPGPEGKLVYVPDEQGNTIPDFSNCGYKGGGVRLPEVPVKVILEPAEGDAG